MKITQFSTMSALMLGRYERATTIGEILKVGDFGVGTFEGMFGELLLLDGKAYNGLPGGKVETVQESDGLAFATVGQFGEKVVQKKIASIASVEQLKEIANGMMEDENHPYLLRVDATFKDVLVRSCHKQGQPYRPLYEVAKDQVETRDHDIEGTLIGIWFPSFAKGFNLDNWHFHFLSKDHERLGGHCLQAILENATLSLCKQDTIEIHLPEDAVFNRLDFKRDISKETASVEGKSQKK